MSLFSDAYTKVFLGTKGSQAADPGVSALVDEGFLMETGISTEYLSETGAPYALGLGTFGMFSQENWESVVIADLAGNNCCPLILASSSVRTNDKQGPFHGGYKESNKSKFINPNRITKFYRVDQCIPKQQVIHIGHTPYTETLSDPTCCFEFYCDETYYLQLDAKGSPALRFANHNLYQRFQADGGCCDGPVPTVIDSTIIMIQWAKQIADNNYFKQMVQAVVFDENQNPWFATAEEAVAAGWPADRIFDNYPATAHQDGECAGIRLIGAFVETKFGDCTFQTSDHYEIEPLKFLASLVDYTGDPCIFEGICVETECPGIQGIGFGESALRELILSERYLQNTFNSNLRIREITQGTDTLAAIDRNALYTRYFIQHTVPQHANNNQTYDNQQYMLEIITNAASAGFEAFMAAWLTDCGDCTALTTEDCTDCTPIAVPVEP
jgi:hypothetical protein